MLYRKDYQTFHCFTFQGKKFLALETYKSVEVYNKQLDNFGTYFSVNSFKTMAKKYGIEFLLYSSGEGIGL